MGGRDNEFSSDCRLPPTFEQSLSTVRDEMGGRNKCLSVTQFYVSTFQASIGL